jgi:predicted nucleic acid-binding protein
MRVVVDTNVVVSAIANRKERKEHIKGSPIRAGVNR